MPKEQNQIQSEIQNQGNLSSQQQRKKARAPVRSNMTTNMTSSDITPLMIDPGNKERPFIGNLERVGRGSSLASVSHGRLKTTVKPTRGIVPERTRS